MTRDQTMDRRRLYGEIEPYASERLKVSDIHELHYEESGNPDGKPVVFLHGGLGGASIHDCKLYRRFRSFFPCITGGVHT